MMKNNRIDISFGAIILGLISYFHMRFSTSYLSYSQWTSISIIVTGLEMALFLLLFYWFAIQEHKYRVNFLIFILYIIVYFTLWSFFSFSFAVESKYFGSGIGNIVKGAGSFKGISKLGALILFLVKLVFLIIITRHFLKIINPYNSISKRKYYLLFTTYFIIAGVIFSNLPRLSYSFWLRYVDPITIKREIALSSANLDMEWLKDKDVYAIKASLTGPIYDIILNISEIQEENFQNSLSPEPPRENKVKVIRNKHSQKESKGSYQLPLLPVFDMFDNNYKPGYGPSSQSINNIPIYGGVIRAFSPQPEIWYFFIPKKLLSSGTYVFSVKPIANGRRGHVFLYK